MVDNINELKVQAAKMFTNFSDILKKDIRDKDGGALGKVWDMSLKFGEIYPRTNDLIISKGSLKKIYASIPWSAVADLEDDVLLNITAEKVKFDKMPKEYEFLLRRDILDQQVVDTFNHKVRRVNDVHLLKVDHELVVAHVDIGLRGLVRRLGWESTVDFCVRAVSKDSDYLKKADLVSWKYVQPVNINPASMTMKLAFSEKQIMAIPPADLGDIIFDLTPTQRMIIFRTLDIRTKARVFENLELEEQKAILRELDKKEAAQIVSNMSSDEATDLLEKLPAATVRNLLVLIESSRAKKLSGLLGYSSDSAGGLMTTELVSIHETMTVGAAIDYIKNQTKEVETVPYIYIIDDANHLKGVTTIRRLLFADPSENMLKTAFPKLIYVYLNNSVKELAFLIDKYRISAIPVLDENKTLHGIVTVDDILSQVIAIAWRKRASKGL